MKCGRLCVVGNGPSAIHKHNGNFIDSCDHVIRMGNCDTNNYAEFVGSKTTIYAGRWKKLENNIQMCRNCDEIWLLYPEPPHDWNSNYIGDESIIRNSMSIERIGVNDENIKYVPRQLCDHYRNIYTNTRLPKKSDESCGFNIPATGTVAIDMAVLMYQDHDIYITGFDGYFLNTSYYFDKTRTIGRDFTNHNDTLTQFVELKKTIIHNNIIVI